MAAAPLASSARAPSTPCNADFEMTHDIQGAETSSFMIMKRNIANTDHLIKEAKLYKHKCEQLSSEIESINKQKRDLESSCQNALIEQINAVKTNKELKNQLDSLKEKLLLTEINEKSLDSHKKQLEDLLSEREMKLEKMAIEEKNIKLKHKAKVKDLREKYSQSSKKLQNQTYTSRKKILELYKFILSLSKVVPTEKLSKAELQFFKRCEKKYDELNCPNETNSSKKLSKYPQVEEFKDNVFSPLSCVSVDSGRSSFHSDDVKCQDSQIFPIEDLDDAFVPLSPVNKKTLVNLDTSPISIEEMPNIYNDETQFYEKEFSFKLACDQSGDDEISSAEVRKILETYRSVSLISPFPPSETEDKVQVNKSKKKIRMIIKRPKRKRKYVFYDQRYLGYVGVVRNEMKCHRQYLARRIATLETKIKQLSDHHLNFDTEHSRKVQNITNSDLRNTCSFNSDSSQYKKDAEVKHDECNVVFSNNCDTNLDELNAKQNILNKSTNKPIRKSRKKCGSLVQQKYYKVKENETLSKRKFEHNKVETPRKRRNITNHAIESCITFKEKYLRPKCYVNRRLYKKIECDKEQKLIEKNDKPLNIICSKDTLEYSENFADHEEKNCNSNDVLKNKNSPGDKLNLLYIDGSHLSEHRQTIAYDDICEDFNLEHGKLNEKSTLFSSIIQECFYKEDNVKGSQNIVKTSVEIKDVCDILIEYLTTNISVDKLNELITRISVYEDIVIANAIIEFISEERKSNGTMIHIPLLPQMPYIQQTCLCFMKMLDKTVPTKDKNIFHVTMAAIEYKSFKLGFTPSIECLCLLTKFYAVLCHVTKQNEQLRLFCVDALYCLTFKAIPVVSVAMQSWPYLFPKPFHRTAKDPLVIVLIHLVSMFYDEKLACYTNNIKFQLKAKYGYEIGNTTDDQMLVILMGYLKDVKISDSLKTAFILFGKRRNAEWCNKRLIIDTLVPFIDNPSTTFESKAFAIRLIGPLIKPFPATMRLQCEVIAKKLITILRSEVLPLVEEALIYSLTFLAAKNHNYQILDSIIKWKPTYTVSEELSSRLNILVRSRNFKFWKQRIS